MKIHSRFRQLASTTTASSLAATVYLLLATPVSAQTRAWSGVCTDDGKATGVATIQGLQCLLANVLSVALTVIGLGGFVMIIWGAFKYLLSGGNSKGTESARSTITFAIVGLVVALSAFIILNLVAEFTGVDLIKQFVVPNSDTGL